MKKSLNKIKDEIKKVYKKHSPNNREVTWPILRTQLIKFEIELNKYTLDMDISFEEPMKVFRQIYRIFNRQPNQKSGDKEAEKIETILGKYYELYKDKNQTKVDSDLYNLIKNFLSVCKTMKEFMENFRVKLPVNQ